MRAKEIIADAIASPLGRDEDIDYKTVYFGQEPTVFKVDNLELRKHQNGGNLWYGLLDYTGPVVKMAGILQLEKERNFWQVRLTQIAAGYKGKGLGSLLYDYAVMNDGLTLLSDFTQTEGGAGGSKGLWEKLYRQGRFTVCGYDVDTEEIIPLDHAGQIADKIYTQKDDVVWMAKPKAVAETINEMQRRLQQRNRARTVQWYGEGITE